MDVNKRIEISVKKYKKNRGGWVGRDGGSRWGTRVDVKIKKKFRGSVSGG